MGRHEDESQCGESADRRASTGSDFGGNPSDGPDDEDHIRVICRVRPSTRSTGALGPRTCVSVDGDGKTVSLRGGTGPKLFTFDHSVGPEGGQEVLFQMAGKPATRACMQGYHGTIFAYGQTGSGKTYTMFGPNLDGCDSNDDRRGLVPRALEYLFAHVAREERRNAGAVKYLCRCSFYEIFNERVFDLLDSNCSLGGLQTREDMKKGVYVEGLTEEAVDDPRQAYQVLTRGYRNRHVGETAMNRESSRSHAVFTVVLESREVDTRDGITRSRCASFNLVDLAGSERQSASGATGERLKEAGSINKSLSALGNVINALVSGKTRYIPYRDSRLTFLLRDSLGGNAKTFLVAAVSPNDENFAETLSTLKFAQRAKMIKNKAVINEDTSGTVEALQKQLRQIRQELLSARAVISASSGGSALSGSQEGEAQEASVGVEGASLSDIKKCAKYKRTQALLKEALDRSLRLEQARELAEQMATNVQATVDRLEQNVLHEKMVRKLKESQIQRHLKKQRQAEPADLQEDGVLPPTTTNEDELRQEIGLLRKEMDQVPLETVKWKTAAENAQLQLDALVDEKGLGMWVESRETAFVSSLEKELKAAINDKERLEEQVRQLEEELKNRPARAYKPRLSDGGIVRLKETEQRCAALEEELAGAKKLVQDCEGKLAETRASAAQAMSGHSQLMVKLTLAERRLEAVESENKVLKADRDANMAALKDRIEHLQAQHQEHAAKQDVEEQLAAACKDNTILLQRLREAAAVADKASERQKEMQVRAQEAAEEMKNLRSSVETVGKELEDSKQAAIIQTQDFEVKKIALSIQIANMQAEIQSHETRHGHEVAELRNAMDEATGRVQALKSEKEELSFQLANLQEDHDTLTELTDFTSGKNAELEQALAESQASIEKVEKDRARTKAMIDDLKGHILGLENQLDKAGGDAAEERIALRDLEKANQELIEERDRLFESVDAGRLALLEAQKEHTTAAEHARRQAQVVSDLSDQISKLRSDLEETVAKEQQASGTADGLRQEREDLVQRAIEAEEAQAELAEETKTYLEEISALKLRLIDLEKMQEEKRAQYEGDLARAHSETSNMLQQIESFQKEVNSLKERLDEKQQLDESEALIQVEDIMSKLKDSEKQLQEEEWKHTQEMAGIQKGLAEAEARAAEAVRFKAALGTSELEYQALKAQSEKMQKALDRTSTQLEAANERCEALANQVGAQMSAERDFEAWSEEKAKWKAEVKRARQMEKESFDRFEMAEQQRVKYAKEVEALSTEIDELKAANVKLIAHGNNKQKIQLHHKLKEELSDLTKKCKALEAENYNLQYLQGKGARAEGGVLGEVTNTVGRSIKKRGAVEKPPPTPGGGRLTRSAAGASNA